MSRVLIVLLLSSIFFAFGLYFSSTLILPYITSPQTKITHIGAVHQTPTIVLPTPTITPLPTLVIVSPTLTPTPTPIQSGPTKVLPVPTVIIKSEVTIMPLGDSITYGIGAAGSYRTQLWKWLVNDGDRINFVGSMSSGSSDLGDSDHEGHIGWEIGQVDGNVISWITAYKPEIVLLHIGSNDIDHGVPADVMVARLSSLVNHIFVAKPTTYLIRSTLIPINRGDQATWHAFNAAIPGIVAQYRSQGYKIVAVNMSNALTGDDLVDGIHPNKSGYNKMAGLWYPVVTTVYQEYASAYNLQ